MHGPALPTSRSGSASGVCRAVLPLCLSRPRRRAARYRCQDAVGGARSLGAGNTVMWRIVLPNLRTAAVLSASFSVAPVLGEFTIANLFATQSPGRCINPGKSDAKISGRRAVVARFRLSRSGSPCPSSVAGAGGRRARRALRTCCSLRPARRPRQGVLSDRRPLTPDRGVAVELTGLRWTYGRSTLRPF